MSCRAVGSIGRSFRESTNLRHRSKARSARGFAARLRARTAAMRSVASTPNRRLLSRRKPARRSATPRDRRAARARNRRRRNGHSTARAHGSKPNASVRRRRANGCAGALPNRRPRRQPASIALSNALLLEGARVTAQSSCGTALPGEGFDVLEPTPAQVGAQLGVGNQPP